MGRKREGNGMVRVRVLGAVELQIGHRRIGMNTEVLFGLALVLTTRAGERIPRDELLELLWSKGSDDQRRHALRQMLYRLRQKGLGLEEDGDKVMVEAARVDSDLRAALDPAWVDGATAEQVDAAATFGPTFSRRMAPGFVAWVDELRERLSHQHRKASLRQINIARREARWADLERWAQSVLKSDPLNEEATMARAESAAMAGSKTMAIEILDAYLAEVQPISPDLGKPALALRKRLAERRADWTLRGPKEVALVGREEVMSRLTGLVEAAWKGEGSSVVLVGAPGIGKTRLAREVQGYAELKGMRTLVLRAQAGMSEHPLVFAQALVSAVLELPGAAACSPNDFELLTALARERPQSDLDAQRPGSPDQERIGVALAELARRVGEALRVLIVLEDMHAADHTSQHLALRFAKAAAGSRIATVLTSRDSLRPRSQSFVVPALAELRVPHLDQSSSVTLAIATARAHSLRVETSTAEEVAAAGAGNPLFVRELSLHRAAHASDTATPRTLTHLISERLDRLPTKELRLLRQIALLGDACSLPVLRHASKGDLQPAIESVERLEQEGIIGVDQDGRLRIHDCWREVLLEGTPAATKHVLAFECAEAILTIAPASAEPKAAWRAADLYRLAGHHGAARDLYITAADRLLSLGFSDEAASVLERTRELCSDAHTQIAVLSRLSNAQLAGGETESALETSTASVRLLRLHGSPNVLDVATSHFVRAEATMKLSLPSDEVRHDLLRLAEDPQLPANLRLSTCLYGLRVCANANDRPLADQFHSVVTESVAKGGRSVHASLAKIVYAVEYGSPADVLEASASVDIVSLGSASAFDRARLLRFQAHSLRTIGRFEEAVHLGTEAFEFARKAGLSHDLQLACELLAFIFLDLDDVSRGEHWIRSGEEALPTSQYRAQSVSLNHLRARLALQQGDYPSTIERLSNRILAIEGDGSPKSMCSDLATLAYALMASGHQNEASMHLDTVCALLAPLIGSYNADYPCELAARTLTLGGRADEATSLSAAHLAARGPRTSVKFPAFYRALELARTQRGTD